jgi:hypothetical protein
VNLFGISEPLRHLKRIYLIFGWFHTACLGDDSAIPAGLMPGLRQIQKLILRGVSSLKVLKLRFNMLDSRMARNPDNATP